MKPEGFCDLEKLYDQTLNFLEGAGVGKRPIDPGPRWTEYQNNFRTSPKNYLLKDNLLLLLKDV